MNRVRLSVSERSCGDTGGKTGFGSGVRSLGSLFSGGQGESLCNHRHLLLEAWAWHALQNSEHYAGNFHCV